MFDGNRSIWENMPLRQLGIWTPMVLGVLFLLWLTSLWGPGATPDTANYLAAARAMAAGDSWTIMGNRPLLWWPPLFPLTWSLGLRLGLPPMLAVTLIHVIAWLAFAYAWAKLCFENLAPHWAYLCWLCLGLGLATMRLFNYGLSEPGFCALLAWSFVWLIRSQKRGDAKALVMAALFAAAACMWRFVGVPLVMAGCCYLVVQNDSFKARLQKMLLWSLVSLTPLALWLLRNWQISGTFTGVRPPARHSFITQFEASLAAGLHWINLGSPARSLATLISVGLLGVLAIVLWWRVRHGFLSTLVHRFRNPVVILMLSFALLYWATFLILSSLSFTSLANARFIAPMVPCLALATAILLTPKPKVGIFKPSLPWIIGTVWTIFFLLGGLVKAYEERQNGWGVRHRVWQTSPLIQTMRSLPIETFIYSNVRPEIYLHTGIDGAGLPQRRQALDGFSRNLHQNGGMVAWSKIPPPERKPYDFATLRELFPNAFVMEFRDGWILNISPED